MPGPAPSLPSSIRSHPGMSQFPLRRIHRVLFPALGIAAGAGKSPGITWNPEREFASEVQQENEANARKVPRINAEIKEGNCFPQEKSLEMGMVRAGGALDKTLGSRVGLSGLSGPDDPFQLRIFPNSLTIPPKFPFSG